MEAERADSEPKPRTAREAAGRCLALLAVVMRSLGREREAVVRWIDTHGLAPYLSNDEREYLEDAAPPRQADVNLSWRSEALAALLWALGEIPSLEPLNEQVSISAVPACQTAERDPAAFLAGAALRTAQEIEEAEYYLFDQHWRVRDAHLFQKPMPTELHPGIVYERRYALSWLVGWGDGWDDVPTDT